MKEKYVSPEVELVLLRADARLANGGLDFDDFTEETNPALPGVSGGDEGDFTVPGGDFDFDFG